MLRHVVASSRWLRTANTMRRIIRTDEFHFRGGARLSKRWFVARTPKLDGSDHSQEKKNNSIKLVPASPTEVGPIAMVPLDSSEDSSTDTAVEAKDGAPDKAVSATRLGLPIPSDPYEEWQKRVDKTTGREFYYHVDSKQATWEHPSLGLAPAKVSRRVAAGLIDLALAMVFSSSLGAFLSWELDGVFYGQLGLMAGFMAALTGKDAIFEGGARSPGKRLMSIEIVQRKDGAVPSRLRNLSRNLYFPLFEGNQAMFPFVQLFMLSDIILMNKDRHRRRYGDFMTGTCVVPEMPLMAQRVAARQEQMRLQQLREEMGNAYPWANGKLKMWDDEALQPFTDKEKVVQLQPKDVVESPQSAGDKFVGKKGSAEKGSAKKGKKGAAEPERFFYKFVRKMGMGSAVKGSAKKGKTGKKGAAEPERFQPKVFYSRTTMRRPKLPWK